MQRAKQVIKLYEDCREGKKSKHPEKERQDGMTGAGGTGETETDNHCSYDPNDKMGPSGYGDAGYIANDAFMPFTVYFENDPEKATAPAQEIRIADYLDENLDLRTFELREIAFANHVIAVPSGRDYFQTIVDLRPDGIDAIVEIEAGVDPESRQFFATFRALDPVWGWRPENPLVGLLYPNDDTGRGEGSVSYMVKPMAELSSGEEITNRATIVFDYNDPIDTPLVRNVLDSGVPTSGVSELPDRVTTNTLLLTWSGVDDLNGSGIAGYDILQSVDDGPYVRLIKGTTDTYAQVNVATGHKYAFYSVAVDNVGHRELPPETPDATTVVEYLSDPRIVAVNVLTESGGVWPATVIIGFTDRMVIQSMIEDGTVLDAVMLVDVASGHVPLHSGQFSYDEVAKTLSISLESLAEHVYELRLDGSQLVDEFGSACAAVRTGPLCSGCRSSMLPLTFRPLAPTSS